MFKKIFFFICSSILFLGCSDKEHDSLVDEIGLENPENQHESLPLGLVADVYNRNIYEMVLFTLKDSTYKGPNESIALPLKFSDLLDSLVWEIEGHPNKMNLLDKRDNGFKFTVEWGHYFYLPGDYKTFLRGYKDKDMIVQDSAVVTIFAKGDFLNVYWNQLDENLNQKIGYTNNDTKDYSFQILTSLRDDVLSSRLSVRFNVLDYMKYNPEIGNKELDILSAYITGLYGRAKHDSTDQSMYEEFRKLFKTDIKRDQVVKVWIAEKSNIALIKNDTWQEDGFGYEILAEPNY